MAGTRYCHRCRAQVPVEEFELRGDIFFHMGEMRGVYSWDSDADDRTCGAAFGRVPERR
jgi:hypothetical protein